MPRVFISYRRDDSGYIAGMLAERLEEALGKDSVFIDVDAIPLGVDFREHLTKAVAKSDMLLALIGDDWLTITNPQGKRRLDDPADFVRIEIEAALKRNIAIIPVLVGRALMPNDEDLPTSLQPLVFRNAAEVRSGRNLNHHIDQLVWGIKDHYANLQTAEPIADSAPSINEEKPVTASEAPSKAKPKPLAIVLSVIGVLAVSGLALAIYIKSLGNQTPSETNAVSPTTKIEPLTNQVPSTKQFNSDTSNANVVQQVPNFELPIVPPIQQVPLTNQFDIKSITPDKGSLPAPSNLSVNYFQPCLAGTRNVIVGSGYDTREEALARLKRFRLQYPNYKFKLLSTSSSTAPYSNEQSAIVVGHGLDLASAQQLLSQVRSTGVASDAYITNQTVSSDCIDLSGFET